MYIVVLCAYDLRRWFVGWRISPMPGSSNHWASNIINYAQSEQHTCKAAMLHLHASQAKATNASVTSYSPIASGLMRMDDTLDNTDMCISSTGEKLHTFRLCKVKITMWLINYRGCLTFVSLPKQIIILTDSRYVGNSGTALSTTTNVKGIYGTRRWLPWWLPWWLQLGLLNWNLLLW